jgi:hypothetical protein
LNCIYYEGPANVLLRNNRHIAVDLLSGVYTAS